MLESFVIFCAMIKYSGNEGFYKGPHEYENCNNVRIIDHVTRISNCNDISFPFRRKSTSALACLHRQ